MILSLNAKQRAALSALFVILVLVRIPGIDQFAVTDEAPWLMRSANFYNAVAQREFQYTYQGTPGVTTMWLGTFSFLIHAPEYRGMGWGFFDQYPDFYRLVYAEAPNLDLHQILVTARVLTAIFVVAMLIVALALMSQYMKFHLVILIGLWVGLSPMYLGYTRLAHLDGMQSTGMFLSLAAMWAFLNDKDTQGRWLMIVISAFGAAVAMLTRLPGILIIPMWIVAAWLARRLRWKDWKYYLLWFGAVSLLFIMAWPAAWKSPSLLVQQTLYPVVQRTNESVMVSTNFLMGKISWRYWLRYFDAYVWKVMPITITGLIVFGVSYVRRQGIFKDKNIRDFSVYILSAGLLYMVIMTFPSKWSTRYALISFMIFDVLVVLGIGNLLSLLLKKKNFIVVGVLSLLIVFSFAHASSTTYPYYINYYNPLCGGGKKANNTRFVGYGEGLDVAARYLANKENAGNLTVAAWYGYGPFSFFFPGKSFLIPTGVTWSNNFINMLQHSDYLVVYANQWHRNIPPELFTLLDNFQPEKSVWLNDIEYVRIYRVDDFRDMLNGSK